jgi:hypothetical protein
VTKTFLSRTNQVGSPWLSRSVVSGNDKQMRRRVASGSFGMARLWHPVCSRTPDARVLEIWPDYSR